VDFLHEKLVDTGSPQGKGESWFKKGGVIRSWQEVDGDGGEEGQKEGFRKQKSEKYCTCLGRENISTDRLAGRYRVQDAMLQRT